MNTFHIGQIVQLKSGGPVMTVEGVAQGTSHPIQCAWFTPSGEFYFRAFVATTLIVVDDASN